MTEAMEEPSARAPRVAIVGGGMAGLSAAWELERWSRTGMLAVDLFEATPRVGGPVVTDLGSGFALEGGPDSFLTSKPDLMELLEELGLSGSLIGVRASARAAYIFRAGRLHRIPPLFGVDFWSAARAIRSTTLIGWPGKLRMGLGVVLIRLRPIRTDDRIPLGPQIRSRFGGEATDWLFEPFLGGVHSTPIDRLSPAAVATILPARWTAAASSRPSDRAAGPRRVPFASLRDGMASLPRRLSERLEGTRVHLRTGVVGFEREGNGYRLRLDNDSSTFADGVILAVSGFEAARLLRATGPPGAAQELDEAPKPPNVVVGLVYRREDIPISMEGTGVLVPLRTGLPVAAITWLSSKWDRDDPEAGKVALRAFLRPRDRDGSGPEPETESVERARLGLYHIMGVRAAPTYSVVFAHARAIPWYEVGHAARVARARRALSAWPRVELAGNSYDGIGLPDVVGSGRAAARRLIAALGTSLPARSEHAKGPAGPPDPPRPRD